MKKLAIVLPGVGYHTDKPLLYYSKKIAKAKDYQIIDISYNFTDDVGKIKFDEDSMAKAIDMGLNQMEEQLSDLDFSSYDRIIFIGKSIGTAIAARYDITHGISGEHIVFTPVPATFEYLTSYQGLVFHGNMDPLCDTDLCIENCEEMSLTYAVVPQANHSLETGDVLTDIDNLHRLMKTVEKLL